MIYYEQITDIAATTIGSLIIKHDLHPLSFKGDPSMLLGVDGFMFTSQDLAEPGKVSWVHHGMGLRQDEVVERIQGCGASLTICPQDLKSEWNSDWGGCYFATKPKLQFLRIMQCYLHEKYFVPRIGPDGVHYAYHIDDESIVIHPTAQILPGAVIGGPGFSFIRDESDSWVPFPHLGGVIIGEDVWIGSNTVIDRGLFGNTIIQDGAKIDNLVHVAHDVIIGSNTLVIAHVMLGGNASIGKEVRIAPNSSIMNNATIGDRSVVGMHSLVRKDVPSDTVVYGVPAKRKL